MHYKSSNLFSYRTTCQPKLEKNLPSQKILIFQEMELSSPPKNLINSFRRNWILEQHLLFTGCSRMEFFHSPPFPEHIQWGHLLYPTIHCAVLVCPWDAMPRHCSPNTPHPILSREAEDFPRGSKYPEDVPLPTFLAHFNQFKINCNQFNQ